MTERPACIKHWKELMTEETFSYPGDTETFGHYAPLSRKMGLSRIGINHEVLQPGDRCSWPHAHKVEEEFVHVLEGTPHAWIDGKLHELKPGDSVAFPAGTGHAHTIINNSEQEVRLMVVGEIDPPNEQVFYPMHSKRNEEIKEKGWLWEDHPEQKLDSHDGWPDKKRP